jgi:hypothetical protein
MDRSWSFINDKAIGGCDPKQVRVGLQMKLALLSLVQDYARLQEIAASLVDLASRSPELSQFVSDQLNMFLISSPKASLRVIARSAIQSLSAGSPLPHRGDERSKRMASVFIVAADDSQQLVSEKLAQALEEKGISVAGVDLRSDATEAKLIPPHNLETRFSKGANEEPFLNGLAETVSKFIGEEPKLVSVSNPNNLDPGKYEIWFSKH